MYRVSAITTKLVNYGNGKTRENVTMIGVSGPIHTKRVYTEGDTGAAICRNFYYFDRDTAFEAATHLINHRDNHKR